MSKFGLMDEPLDSVRGEDVPAPLSDKLAAFSASAPRHRIDLAAMDAAAAAHGFISREAAYPATVAPMAPITPVHAGRRRRIAPIEPTRHLAIRLTTSQYERFVAYADKHRLTYHDALAQLLDIVERQ